MRRLNQTIALLLSLLLVLCNIPPLQAKAEVINSTTASAQNVSSGPSSVVSDLQPGDEVTSLRTENSKTFYVGNGEYNRKYYFQPVHKKVNGKWTDISSSLVDSTDGSAVNTENALLTSKFNKKMNNGQYGSFEVNGETVSYSLVSASGEAGSVQVNDGTAVYKQKKNTVLYKNVFPDIDLRNLTFDQNIKEDLVFHSYQGYNTFKFHLKTSLLAEQQKDGSINFHKNGSDATIFTLPKPFMDDSNFDQHSGDVAQSDHVIYNLVKTDDGYDLTVQADASWLKDPSRVYPVYLDPSTSITTSSDAFIMSAYPDTNYSSSSSKWDSTLNAYILKVGDYDSTTGNCYGYLSEDLSSLANMNVTSATFNAYVAHSYYATTATGLWLGTANSAWSPSTLTWNQSPYTSTVGSVNVAQNQWATFDVTSTIQAWVNGTKPNYGFALHTNNNGQTYWKKITSTVNSTNQPYLSVNYTIPAPNTPTSSTSSDGTGSNNTGYVNLSWNAVPGATGYKVWVYNGITYESYSVGNVTSWSTHNQKIWPTQSEINAGRYTLHHDGLGTELPVDPAPVYKNSGGNYSTSHTYWFTVSAIFAQGESAMSNYNTSIIPLEPPAAPTGTAASSVTGKTGYINLNWTKNPGATGYKVWIYNGISYESFDVGNTDHWMTESKGIWPTDTEIASGRYLLHHDGTGTELASNPAPVYKNSGGNYSTSTTYWMTVSAYNSNSESNMSPYYATTIQNTGKVSITSPSNNATTSGTLSISGTTNLDKMNLSITKYGTNKAINIGDITGASGTWTWDTTKVSDGEYLLTLTGTDYTGSSITSKINIKVQNIAQGMGVGHGRTVDNHTGTLNMVNGNLVVSKTDINMPGRGLGTNFTRVYNSQMKTNGVLGWGWRIDVPELSQYSDGSVAIIDGDGAKHSFSVNADGSYTAPKGDYDILIKNAADMFTLKSKDGTKYVFDLTNNKVSQINKNNNTVVYQYDGNNRLTSITDPTNRVTSFTYDSTTGKLISVKDCSARTWSYSYDSNGNLSKITDPMQHSESYAYDANHQLISVTDANGNITSLTYTSNQLASVTNPAPLSNKTAYSYDVNNKQFSETDPKGNTTTYTYDANGNVLSVTDALNNSTSYTYDGNFNVLTKTDALGNGTTYTYDSMGNELTETDSMGHTTTYTYDANNNKLTQTDALGKVTNYAYDTNGNQLSDGTNTYTYNQDGTIATETDAKGNTTTFSYDANGNVSSQTDALNNQIQMSYDATGNKVSQTDAGGNKTTYTYDAMGHMLTVTTGNTTTSYTYDANGNKLTSTDANGNNTAWSYDALNRVVSETDPGNKVQGTAFDANGNIASKTAADGTVTTYTYDALNRQTQVKNPDGTTSSYQYDAVGNRISMTDFTGTTTYSYDKNSNLTKQTNPDGKVTTYTYDADNQQTGKVVDGKSVTYNYDSQSNLTSMVDSNNLTTGFSYDANKNKTAVTYSNGTKINYGYDASNEVTDVNNLGTGGNGIANFHYTYANGQIGTVTDSNGVTSYTYDDQNRLIKITDPTGKVTDYTYDSVGNRASTSVTVSGVKSTTTYTYDAGTNELTNITNPDGSTVSYKYDVNGNTLSKTDNIGTTTYEYNSINQLTKVTQPNGNVIKYAYDGDNKRISKTVNGVVTKYVYDGNQVSEETDASGNVLATYSYGDKGTPVSVSEGGKVYNYQYNGHGDVVALTDSTGHVVEMYTYDAWGNVTAKTGNIDNLYGYAGQYGYVYDQETGFYFLQSRYYDPENGRFTTKDRFIGFDNDPQSLNLYTYVKNDPVNGIDPSGHYSLSYHWWGWQLTLSERETQNIIKLMNWGAAAGALATFLGGGIPAGITSALLWLGSATVDVIDYWGNNRGVHITHIKIPYNKYSYTYIWYN